MRVIVINTFLKDNVQSICR